MRSTPLTIAPLAACAVLLGCSTVPVDSGAGSRVIPPAGVIQGSALYQGPHPCSRDGHIVGNLVLLFFDQNDPPPPAGIASTAVNFGVVAGDVLFANEPRAAGSTTYCPKDHGDTGTITASAPFAVSPFAAGTYVIESFFDYTGDFLPTFKFRQLPEEGDVAGGYIDTTDAILHADAGVDYKPIFLPVTVGVPAGSVDAGADAAVGAGLDGGTLVLPPNGYVASNVTVSVGSVLPIPRPYFYVQGVTAPASHAASTPANPSGDPHYAPAETMAQDIQILAQPTAISPANVATFQASLVSMSFMAGVPTGELAAATDPSGPFHFQLTPSTDATSLFVWTDGTKVPENDLISNLLPEVVFTKLIDDPDHTLDPQSVTQQVPPTGPVVVLLGLNLGPKTGLLDLVGYPVKAPGPEAATTQINVLVRPVAICVDPTQPQLGATIVTPFLEGTIAGSSPPTQGALFDATVLSALHSALEPIFGTIHGPVQGCLPPGRYAPNFVYPTGEAWTVPNESGSCAPTEGALELSASSSSGALCSGDGGAASRDVLFSQGPRAVLEITKTANSSTCAKFPVPKACGGP